ncbi:MAG: aspartate aminotransferase family protein [Verrucomicrobiota bacterium]
MLPEINTPIPGPRSHALAQALHVHESQNITFTSDNFPVFWERGQGVNVWDADGNRFLDFTSAFGVTGLGHNHPAIVEAATRQSQRLLHAMGDVHPSPLKAELCAKLSTLTFERWNLGPAKSILANSGFEAVEAALKTAYTKTNKPGVITFDGAYHGLGYGALAAGALPKFRDPFSAQLADFGTTLPFAACDAEAFLANDLSSDDPDVAASLAEVEKNLASGTVGAILIEPIQGRGGKRTVHPAFLTGLRELCDEFDALLILDEILTGLNRTGKLFACEHFNLLPDIICLGKSLTSGYPLSACIARSEIMDAWPPSSGEAIHTTTFLGNPVGCAMALAALDLHAQVAETTIVAETGHSLRQHLKEIDSPLINSIRGLGLMIGVELVNKHKQPASQLAAATILQALKDGLIILAGSRDENVLSIVPPFDVAPAEIDWASKRLQEYLISLPGSIS